MTLSEIENILLELATRHPDLNEELLRTLLLSAGWEEKLIKEALVLFKQNSAVTITTTVPALVQAPASHPSSSLQSPQIEMPNNDITFYTTDGNEEGVLHSFESVSEKKENVPKETIKIIPPEISHEVVNKITVEEKPKENKFLVLEEVSSTPHVESIPEAVIPQIEIKIIEPESLITHENKTPKKQAVQEVIIPGNLPLLPFESSPHVWSFSRYQDVFHGSIMPKDTPKAVEVIPTSTIPSQPPSTPLSVPVLPNVDSTSVKEVEVQGSIKNNSNEEDLVIVEKIPLTKKDESLVFLAGTMLLVIILILGYMYSNGRL